jgi:phosphatidylglycerophosphatase A
MTPARLIASGLGSGFAPRAPGTAGSLLALVAGAGLLLLPGWVLPAACLAAVLAGLWAIPRAGGSDDPGWVVIDEVAGQWLALLPLAAPTPLGLLAAFALFRLFDITKPGPIGWADRQHGAFGVMADDVLAGLAAALLLFAAQRALPGGWL